MHIHVILDLLAILFRFGRRVFDAFQPFTWAIALEWNLNMTWLGFIDTAHFINHIVCIAIVIVVSAATATVVARSVHL